MASIYILFPKEQPELVSAAMQHFQWAVERFEAMSERNALARAALGVLHAIHIRLKKSLNFVTSNSCSSLPAASSPGASSSALTARSPFPPTPAGTGGGSGSEHASPADGGGVYGFTRGSSTSASVSNGGHGSSLGSAATPTTGSTASGEFYSSHSSGGGGADNGCAGSSAGAGGAGGGFDWNLPSNFDWSSIQPIFATGDLVYNDLVGIPDGSEIQTQWGPLAGVGGGGGGAQVQTQHQQPWQFEGDFGNHSVWNLLNQYTPL
jgi:hypothetical protein